MWSLIFRFPMIKLLQWKLQKLAFRVLNELNAGPEDLTYIVVQCCTCEMMSCVPNYGFDGIIPGIPVFNYEKRQCSNCMDHETFVALTS